MPSAAFNWISHGCGCLCRTLPTNSFTNSISIWPFRREDKTQSTTPETSPATSEIDKRRTFQQAGRKSGRQDDCLLLLPLLLSILIRRPLICDVMSPAHVRQSAKLVLAKFFKYDVLRISHPIRKVFLRSAPHHPQDYFWLVHTPPNSLITRSRCGSSRPSNIRSPCGFPVDFRFASQISGEEPSSSHQSVKLLKLDLPIDY